MSDSSEAMPQDLPLSYAVRVTPRAQREIEAAALRFADLVGNAIALEWLQGIYAEIRHLAIRPRRHPIIAEQVHFQDEVRQTLYRRSYSSVTYRVLFTVTDIGDDGPIVQVFHMRHGAAKPIGRKEAKDLQAEQ